MKSYVAFLATILALACLALPVASLESKVLTICEKNLSIDLGPGFQIDSKGLDASSKGMVFDNFFINSTSEPSPSAFISILTLYDEILSKMNPEALSELFLIGGVEAAVEEGDAEVGQWTAVDRRGRNVSVTTMKTENEDVQMPDGIYNITVWNLDNTTYALLVSAFDEYNTTQIIRTLTVG